MNPFNDPGMAAYWIAMIRDGVNPFRQYVIEPALHARLERWPAGGRMLDVGCGEGYLGRWWQQRGQRVVGFDLSLPLLQAARQAAMGAGYVGGSVFELPFANGVFDGAVANFLLVEFAEPAEAIKEIGRVLRPGGRFLFQGIHPFTFGSNAGQSGGQKVSDYFKAQRFEEKFIVDGRESPLASPRYHHPLSTYTHALAEHGFWMTALEEPRPVEATPADHPIREILREPWFILIEAVKQGLEIGNL
jgi:SAM-dependent methyltransferase